MLRINTQPEFFSQLQASNKIIGCAMRVQYQRSLAIELGEASLEFKREKEQTIYYKNIEVGTRRADFIVENKVIVELFRSV